MQAGVTQLSALDMPTCRRTERRVGGSVRRLVELSRCAAKQVVRRGDGQNLRAAACGEHTIIAVHEKH
jgi:hypothetical protein